MYCSGSVVCEVLELELLELELELLELELELLLELLVELGCGTAAGGIACGGTTARMSASNLLKTARTSRISLKSS